MRRQAALRLIAFAVLALACSALTGLSVIPAIIASAVQAFLSKRNYFIDFL